MTPVLLTRRDFLKLSAAALLGVLFSDLRLGEAQAAPLPGQGRVLYSRMKVRVSPSFQGEQVGSLLFDNLVSLSARVTGGDPADYNRTWFQLEDGGYVYSGGIQPVETRLNETRLEIPAAGLVGEVSIPCADSQWAVNRSPTPGPRLYYASAHWVNALVTDQRDGSLWYRCYDNLWQSHYYTRPAGLHLREPDEPAPLTPGVPDDEKHLEVILDEQMLYAFEGGELVYAARAATGKRGFETPTGWYRTFHKRPTCHMAGGYDDASIYDLPGVPWDSYITAGGIAIHGTYWHNDFGAPHSHGCINLLPADARWVYHWTSPRVPAGERLLLAPNTGTQVHVLQSQTSRSRSER